MGTGKWTFEATNNDGKTTVEFEVADPNGSEVDQKLREVQFGFIQAGEAAARTRRANRLAQREQEFSRAVRQGGKWEPTGAPEEYGVTAGSKDEAPSPDGEGSGSGSRESPGGSESGEAVGRKTRVAKPNPKRKSRGRKSKPKAGSAD